MKEIKIEVCAGGYEDCLAAVRGGAHRVELNGALALGGLTPTLAVLEKVKQDTDLDVIAMVRPRAGGFHYNQAETDIMMAEARALLEMGADGLAFGFLNADGTVDVARTKAMTDLIHEYGGTAVFHRAVDVTPDIDAALETLIELGVDRVLTSGQQAKALDGAEVIRRLQETYGDRIQILPGSGVNAENARMLLKMTSADQLHSSCRGYRLDPTTSRGDVSYAYLPAPRKNEYDVADQALVEALVQAVASD